MPPRSLRTGLLLGVVVAAVALGSFAWGVATYRHGVFPHDLLKKVLRRGGVLTTQLDVQPPSKPPAELLALPYVTTASDADPDRAGVTIHDPERAASGLNFYHSGESGTARLFDMEGRIVYEWTLPGIRWSHIELLADGDLLAVRGGHDLVRVDRNSEIVWEYDGAVHHDVDLDADGSVYALENRPRRISTIHPELPVQDELVVTLEPNGEPRSEFSIVDRLLDSPYAFLLPAVSHRDFADEGGASAGAVLDIAHSNHIEVFDGTLADRSPLFARGNLLLSLRNINSILILHRSSGEILWLWGPSNLYRQHHPQLLDTGTILLFDNGDEASRIIEIDPLTREIVWSYSAGRAFFSATRGSVQRLDNGNTLITESDRGAAFEVTPAGEIVWRFDNPRVDAESGEREIVWRVVRFDPEELVFLDRTGRPHAGGS